MSLWRDLVVFSSQTWKCGRGVMITAVCAVSSVTEKLLADLAAALSNSKLLAGNEQFRRGDRVIVQADPHEFREMQTATYGGWNDDMALV